MKNTEEKNTNYYVIKVEVKEGSYVNEVVKELGKDEHNFTAEIKPNIKYLRIHYENADKTHVVTENKLEQMLNAVGYSLTKLTKLFGKDLFLFFNFKLYNII